MIFLIIIGLLAVFLAGCFCGIIFMSIMASAGRDSREREFLEDK